MLVRTETEQVDSHLIESFRQCIANGTSIFLSQSRDNTTDTREFVPHSQLEVFIDPILALENNDTHAYPVDLGRDHPCVTSTDLDRDHATPVVDPRDSDPLMPSSSPLPPSSSSPRIFSSSPLQSSQSSTSEHSLEVSMDLKEVNCIIRPLRSCGWLRLRQQLNSDEKLTAECFSNSGDYIEAEPYPTSLSHPLVLDSPYSESAVTKQCFGLPTCNQLLNDDVGQYSFTEPVSDLLWCNLHMTSFPSGPCCKCWIEGSICCNPFDFIDPIVEQWCCTFVRLLLLHFVTIMTRPELHKCVEEIDTHERDVSTHRDSTLEFSLSENSLFSVDDKLTGSGRMNILVRIPYITHNIA